MDNKKHREISSSSLITIPQSIGGSDRFANTVTRKAIAAHAIFTGYNEAELSVLDVLTDTVRLYTESVAQIAKDTCERGNRSDVAISDLLVGLNKTHPYSVQWKELRDFAFTTAEVKEQEEEIKTTSDDKEGKIRLPFTKFKMSLKRDNTELPFDVPPFPVQKKRKELSSYPASSIISESSSSIRHESYLHPKERQETILGVRLPTYFPQHLPKFPPPHSWKNTIDNQVIFNRYHKKPVTRKKFLEDRRGVQQAIIEIEQIDRKERNEEQEENTRKTESKERKENLYKGMETKKNYNNENTDSGTNSGCNRVIYNSVKTVIQTKATSDT